MSKEAEIRRFLKAIVGIDDLPIPVLGTVVSVDESEMTCVVTPFDSTANITDVKIMGDPDGSATGFYLKPSVGSVVMISPQDSSTYFVSMYSQVDEVWLHGTQYDGLVKIADLVTKLNNLENKVNTIISTFNSHVHSGVTTGVGSSAVSPTPVSGTLTPTTQADLENENVKHG